MLLIIYSAALDFIGIAFSIYPLVWFIIEISQGNRTHLWHLIVGMIGFLLALVFAYIIIQFLSYHFDLVKKNMTTIEHLDEKRGNTREFSYDGGEEFNW